MRIGKVGTDMHHGFVVDAFEDRTIFQQLQDARELGLEGCYYKSPLYLSETLDPVELDEKKAAAQQLGLYLDVGLGRINPCNTPEDPKIWMLTGGDYLRACQKLIEAGARIGCTDMIAACGGFQHFRKGRFQVDRFRTDISWNDQLDATANFLKKLRPALRANGVRVCIETHEEITTFELLRLIQRVGEQDVSVCYDVGNVISRGEEPVAAARRIAPYVVQMHAKDCKVFFVPGGYMRSSRPCGQGVVDFPAIFRILAPHCRDLHIHLEEGLSGARIREKQRLFGAPDLLAPGMGAQVSDPVWLAGHPDLKLEEVAVILGWAAGYERAVARGQEESPAAYESVSYIQRRSQSMAFSIAHLKAACDVPEVPAHEPL